MPEHPFQLDLDWLAAHCKNLVPGIGRLHSEEIVTMIEELKGQSLPMTIGLFGGWGAGKTTILARVAQAMKAKADILDVLYFNAWKHSSFSEVTPALVYRILKVAAHHKEKSTQHLVRRVLGIMAFLGRKHLHDMSEWVKEKSGIDLHETFKGVKDVAEAGSAPAVSDELLEQYLTQIDRAQDAIIEIFEGLDKPLVVLIDELDRCEPNEAFTMIKQLRVFFAMTGAPLILIVTANPEPIGMAIRHQYGLEEASSDYETRRILEKFVDASIDLTEEQILDEFVKMVWAQNPKVPTDDRTFILSLDKKADPAGYWNDTIGMARAYDAIRSTNPYYSNLRVLRKSANVIQASGDDHHAWTRWHLHILHQVSSEFRARISRMANILKEVSAQAHWDLIDELRRLSLLNAGGKLVGGSPIQGSGKGKTAFSIYRSFLWEGMRKRLYALSGQQEPEIVAARESLQYIMEDYHRMDFVACGSAVNSQTAFSEANSDHWRSFGWLLAHF